MISNHIGFQTGQFAVKIDPAQWQIPPSQEAGDFPVRRLIAAGFRHPTALATFLVGMALALLGAVDLDVGVTAIGFGLAIITILASNR